MATFKTREKVVKLTRILFKSAIIANVLVISLYAMSVKNELYIKKNNRPLNALYDDQGNLPFIRTSFLVDEYPAGQPTILSDTAAWSPTSLYGGDIDCIAYDPYRPNVVFCSVGNYHYDDFKGKLYKSVDGGYSWEAVHVSHTEIGRISSIKIAPDSLIWICGYEYLAKSTDGGETWSLRGVPDLKQHCLEIDPSNNNVLYAGCRDTYTSNCFIYKSIDSGANWQNTYAPITNSYVPTRIVVDPQNPNLLFATTAMPFGGGTFLFSDNAGSSWEQRTTGLLTDRPIWGVIVVDTTLFIFGGQPYRSQTFGIFRSDNYGQSWELISYSFPNRYIHDVAVDPYNHSIMYAASDGDGVYKTVDGGEFWDFETSGGDNFNSYSLGINPFNTSMILGGFSNYAIYRSNDAGESFTQSNEGIYFLNLNHIAVDLQNPNMIITTFEGWNCGGALLSTDGGASWNLCDNLPSTRYHAVGFDCEGNIFACSGGPTTIAPEGVYRSLDGGINWECLGPDLGPVCELEISSIDGSSFDRDKIIISGNLRVIGTGSCIFITDDAGNNWNQTYHREDVWYMNKVLVDPTSVDNVILAAESRGNESSGGFLKSMDGGMSWQYFNNGLPAYELNAYDIVIDPFAYISYKLVANQSGSWSTCVYKSTNGGENWQINGSNWGSVYTIAADPFNEQLYYIGRDPKRSTNNGQSWNDYSEGLPHYMMLEYSIQMSDTADIVAASPEGFWRRGIFIRDERADIICHPFNLDFGYIDNDETVIRQLFVVNAGLYPLTVYSLFANESIFDFDDSGFTLAAGGQNRVVIAIDPPVIPGVLDERLIIYSDDPDQPEIIIPLTGVVGDIPAYEYLLGDINMYVGGWQPAINGGSEMTYLVNYFRGVPTCRPCYLNGFWASADVNGDCRVIGSDITRMVSYFRNILDLDYCPLYPPAWLTPDDLPEEQPSGWPNCEMPAVEIQK
jgi:photosystem II stability/assembly factor-like uncharacterized protein